MFDRALSEIMGSTMDQINDYGCWCYFEDQHGQGKGQPVNDVDEYCKQLHQGYDCAKIDSQNACIPWEANYNSRPEKHEDVIPDCTNENPTPWRIPTKVSKYTGPKNS